VQIERLIADSWIEEVLDFSKAHSLLVGYKWTHKFGNLLGSICQNSVFPRIDNSTPG
jgi:hypothetical protein